MNGVIEPGVRPDGPTISVRVGMPKSDGFRTWSEDDIAAFEAIYPVEQGPVRPDAAAQPSVALLADVVRVGGGNVWGGSGLAAGPGVREQNVPAPSSCSAIVLKIPLVAEFPMDKSIATGL